MLSNGTIDNQYLGQSRLVFNLDENTGLSGVANPKIEIKGNGSLTATGTVTLNSGSTVTIQVPLKLSTVTNAGVDTDKFLVIDSSNNVKYRTGAEVLSDIGGISTDTTLTDEQVQDIVGAMVSGNTETNISVTYDDSSGKLNFVSTDTNTTYSEATSSAEGLMSTAHHDKLDGIEDNATADQTQADINGLAITTVGTVDTGTWQGTAIANAYVAGYHWTRSTGGYATMANTTPYTQSWESDSTWGNTVSISTAMDGTKTVNYSDTYGSLWIAPAAGKVTRASIVVRAHLVADDITVKLWAVNPSNLEMTAIWSEDITMPNTSSIVAVNDDLSSSNSIAQGSLLLATIQKQSNSGTSRYYFTWTISGTYD